MSTIKFASIALTITVLLSGCATSIPQPTNQSVAKAKAVHQMNGTYPVFRSLGALVSQSQLVAKATVKEVRASKRVIPDGVALDKLPAYKASAVGYMVTDVLCQIDEVLVGDKSAVGQNVVVVHMGGEDGTNQYVMEDEPISALGSSYMLFLSSQPDGTYAITGGPQGRYLVGSDGSLNPLTEQAKVVYPVASLIGRQSMTALASNFSALAAMQLEAPQGEAKSAAGGAGASVESTTTDPSGQEGEQPLTAQPGKPSTGPTD